MAVIDFRGGEPVYLQLKERLRGYIISGVYKPNERMPSVRELAAGLSVNPNTIQRAVKQSGNVIIDLRKTKRNQERCIRELRKELKLSGSLKRVKVITFKRLEENKKEVPLAFTDTISSFCQKFSMEEIIFQLKRDRVAQAVLKNTRI